MFYSTDLLLFSTVLYSNCSLLFHCYHTYVYVWDNLYFIVLHSSLDQTERKPQLCFALTFAFLICPSIIPQEVISTNHNTSLHSLPLWALLQGFSNSFFIVFLSSAKCAAPLHSFLQHQNAIWGTILRISSEWFGWQSNWLHNDHNV